jgi:hypothetical protein
MREPQLIVLEPKRGRPSASEQRMRVSAWIAVHKFDRLARIANEKDISVSAVIDKLLDKALNP